MRLPRALVETWSHEPDGSTRCLACVADCAEQWSLELEPPVDTPHSLVVPARERRPQAERPFARRGASRGRCTRALGRSRRRAARRARRCTPGAPRRALPAGDASLGRGRRRGDRRGRAAAAPPGRRRHEHPFALLVRRGGPVGGRRAARYAEAVSRSSADCSTSRSTSTARSTDRATRLVNQDLHGGNVLRASESRGSSSTRSRSSASGSSRRAGCSGTPRTVSRWLDVLASVGLDRERARGWGVAHNLAWAWDERAGWSEQHVEEARRILNAR